MIEGVTFDWWHTVAETPWPDYDERMRRLRVESIRAVLADAGLVVDDGALFDAYDRLTDLLRGKWRTHADLGSEEQIGAFLAYAGLDRVDGTVRDDVARAFGEAIRAKLPILYPHVRETLARLRKEGYRVGLVSNTGRTWGRFLRPIQDELGIGPHFHVRVFSDEVGVRKPERKIFEAALAGLDLPPEKVAHVGDDVDADITGAKALGMRAIWFNTGFWSDARTDAADAEIRDHSELFDVLDRWRP